MCLLRGTDWIFNGNIFSFKVLVGLVMTQTVSRWVRSQASTCTIYGGHSVTVTGISPGTPVSPVRVTPPVFHTLILAERQSPKSRIFQKSKLFRKSGRVEQKFAVNLFLVLIYSQDCWLQVCRHPQGPATGHFNVVFLSPKANTALVPLVSLAMLISYATLSALSIFRHNAVLQTLQRSISIALPIPSPSLQPNIPQRPISTALCDNNVAPLAQHSSSSSSSPSAYSFSYSCL